MTPRPNDGLSKVRARANGWAAAKQITQRLYLDKPFCARRALKDGEHESILLWETHLGPQRKREARTQPKSPTKEPNDNTMNRHEQELPQHQWMLHVGVAKETEKERHIDFGGERRLSDRTGRRCWIGWTLISLFLALVLIHNCLPNHEHEHGPLLSIWRSVSHPSRVRALRRHAAPASLSINGPIQEERQPRRQLSTTEINRIYFDPFSLELAMPLPIPCTTDGMALTVANEANAVFRRQIVTLHGCNSWLPLQPSNVILGTASCGSATSGVVELQGGLLEFDSASSAATVSSISADSVEQCVQSVLTSPDMLVALQKSYPYVSQIDYVPLVTETPSSSPSMSPTFGSIVGANTVAAVQTDTTTETPTPAPSMAPTTPTTPLGAQTSPLAEDSSTARSNTNQNDASSSPEADAVVQSPRFWVILALVTTVALCILPYLVMMALAYRRRSNKDYDASLSGDDYYDDDHKIYKRNNKTTEGVQRVDPYYISNSNDDEIPTNIEWNDTMVTQEEEDSYLDGQLGYQCDNVYGPCDTAR